MEDQKLLVKRIEGNNTEIIVNVVEEVVQLFTPYIFSTSYYTATIRQKNDESLSEESGDLQDMDPIMSEEILEALMSSTAWSPIDWILSILSPGLLAGTMR